MRKVQNMTIVSQQSIAKNIYELVLSGDLVQAMLQHWTVCEYQN